MILFMLLFMTILVLFIGIYSKKRSSLEQLEEDLNFLPKPYLVFFSKLLKKLHKEKESDVLDDDAQS